MSLIKKIILSLVVINPVFVFAVNTDQEIFESFKYTKNVSPNIPTPSVVEVPFNKDAFQIQAVAVYNLDKKEFEPYTFSSNSIDNRPAVLAPGSAGFPRAINDNNYETFVEFPVIDDTNKAKLTFTFDKAITSSSMYFVLDNFVALPQKVSISADVNGKDYVVLAPFKPTGNQIIFPKTTSKVWRVTFDYVQPLRITELTWNDLSSNQTAKKGLRFLAQPKNNYQIFFDADRYVDTTDKEMGDLSSNKDIVYVKDSAAIVNARYKPVDSDRDSTPDFSDNCTKIPNSDQLDSNENGRGDACEDYDRDGVVNSVDNCLEIPNSAQLDTDADNIGDVCDSLDNRVTERLPWLPWVGIGVAAIVILGLFILVVKSKLPENDLE